MTTRPPHLAWVASEAARTESAREGRSGTLAVSHADDPLEVLVDLRRQRTPCALCTVIATGGSSPRKPGAKMVVTVDAVHGTIGGGAIEHEIVASARHAIATGEARTVERQLNHDLGMCCGGRMTVFVEPQRYSPSLCVYGAGHVGKPLAAIATSAGFDVTVVDSRPEFASAERFAGVDVICGDPVEHALALPSDPERFVIIVTHDHAVDQAILEALLRARCAYIGVIGSVRKRHRFRERLLASGLEEDVVDRFRTPTGLDIGAVTPGEIAVSIVAELVQTRRGRTGQDARSMAELKKTVARTE